MKATNTARGTSRAALARSMAAGILEALSRKSSFPQALFILPSPVPAAKAHLSFAKRVAATPVWVLARKDSQRIRTLLREYGDTAIVGFYDAHISLRDLIADIEWFLEKTEPSLGEDR